MPHTQDSRQTDSLGRGGGRSSHLGSEVLVLLAPGGKRVYVISKSLQWHPFSPTKLGQTGDSAVKCCETVRPICDQKERPVRVKFDQP